MPLSATDKQLDRKSQEHRTQQHYQQTEPAFIKHPAKNTKHTFSPSALGTYIKVGHILGHKTNPNKFLKIEITQNVFSGQMESLTEINNRKITGNPPNT